MTQNRNSPFAPVALPDEQMQVRVVWLYYMEGRTQGEIAEALSTNRLRVNKIIAEARRSGLVTITLNSRLTSCVALEQQLAAEFSLTRAIIVPTPEDEDLIPVLLGQAAADYLVQLLNGGNIRGIGVGWGATLREMVRHMPSQRRPEICVNSVMGGLTHGIEINTFDIASDLARQLNAECSYLAAPIYAGSPESREAIVRQDVFEAAFRQIEANDVIVLSIGDMTERSLLMRYGLPSNINIEELVAAGACGDVLGQFVDKTGRPIEHPINRCAIAPEFEVLRAIPNVVFASGGLNKVHAIAAVLLSGLGNVLICDEATALQAQLVATELRTRGGS
ncbi:MULTISPECIES: sugar-binding transcriptional regulator [Rhizobium]|uniref:Transcriptional regulator, DeoR family n=1 Tax=Rhizobium leguminosarum bv. trifolii (strain WSM1325) TaxID=395491 RepID=C6B9Z3_RHILS|nr:sugar-binding transcriptional regulator [Rhizobium leguminosarum]ACS61015.1 transcriptional regulator, DeoR family [Rhizobium leguminosarum bv. trifolii WSM1325]MBY2910549.1 sugar-binding transcriptional regulator [Rhizobium leguminosarum]MBY2925454.1 sugar-binding transcriptional regulator [Rhizobium leguminosarum]MBY2932814.1 sugar-binding transcriptional regulator [Rhizobium leguminosarum]MBY2944785.1 sugar-binding transcriptional regulator [Rhizobium leguminosarum]